MTLLKGADLRLNPLKFASKPTITSYEVGISGHNLQELGLTFEESYLWMSAVAFEIAAAFSLHLESSQLLIKVVTEIKGSTFAEGELHCGSGRRPSILSITQRVVTKYDLSELLFVIAYEVGHLIDFKGLIRLPGLPGAQSPSLYETLFKKNYADNLRHRAYMHSKSEVRANAVAWVVAAQLPLFSHDRFYLQAYSRYLGSKTVDRFESLVDKLAKIHNADLPWN